MNNCIKFKKPIYCPNASSLGYDRPMVKVGDLIEYRHASPNSAVPYLGRVLGLARKNGIGEEYVEKRRPFLVLQADCMLTHGYIVHVDRDRVHRCCTPGPFAFWFLFRDMPSVEKLEALQNLGALSNSYIAKYINGDGHGVAPGQDPPVDEELMRFLREGEM